MTGLTGKWDAMITAIESGLKTITELANTAEGRTRVFVYKAKPAFVEGDYEVVIVPGDMSPNEGGVTSRTTWNVFTIIIDLIYCSNQEDTFAGASIKAITVAEKVYDKFHLTNISGTCRLARCNIEVGEGFLAIRNIDAIPVRVNIIAEVPITQ